RAGDRIASRRCSGGRVCRRPDHHARSAARWHHRNVRRSSNRHGPGAGRFESCGHCDRSPGLRGEDVSVLLRRFGANAMKWHVPGLARFLVSPQCQQWQAHSPLLALHAVLGLLFLFSLPARASLDPEMTKPYRLQIVLQIASNRVFTPLFQEQLQRDVQDQLKLYFGALARIEVTRTHPVLLDIETKGGDLALEGWESLSEATTHFVLLDYVAGTYQIQSRFHDGMTGQAGALTQRARTNDRTAVASTVARMIESSFSPVGTVTALGKK